MDALRGLVGGGVDWDVRLERTELLPGRSAGGEVHLTAREALSCRGVVAALVATEQWRHRETRTDGQGHVSSHVVTETHELQRLPVQLLGPTDFAAGEQRALALAMPVPGLGPATFEGSVSRLTWRLELKVDLPGIDPGTTCEVVVLQPTALLRAGVVPVGAFALYPEADLTGAAFAATLTLDPVPLCCGADFSGRLTAKTGQPMALQEVRAALIVDVEATVSNGEKESLTLWHGQLAGAGPFGGADEVAVPVAGTIPATWLPTVELPHGRSSAHLEITLARAWAPDVHLRRDVAICSTTEL